MAAANNVVSRLLGHKFEELPVGKRPLFGLLQLGHSSRTAEFVKPCFRSFYVQSEEPETNSWVFKSGLHLPGVHSIREVGETEQSFSHSSK